MDVPRGSEEARSGRPSGYRPLMDSHQSSPRVLARRHRFALGGTTVAALALRSAIPPNILANSPHDDELMLRLAAEIMDGNWLGPYEQLGQLTLAKSAGYPLFLAVTSRLPWEVPFSVHLLICLGALLFVRELLRLGAPPLLATVTYAILVLHPLWFGDEASRLYREGLLVAIAIISVALGVRLVHHLLQPPSDPVAPPRSIVRLAGSALLFGLVLSVAVATKAGWSYLAVILAAIPVTAPFWAVGEVPPTQRLLRSGTVLLATLVGVALLPVYILSMNSAHYGVRLLDNYAHGEYPRTYAAMSAVRADPMRRYLIVGRSQREAIYAVSPTARELEPYLELPDGEGWRFFPCVEFGICDDSMVWFTWDLRHAIEDAGLGESAVAFEATNRRIREDIEAACREGTLDCGAGGLGPGLPPLSALSRRELLDAFPLALQQMLALEVGSMERRLPPISADQVELWQRFVDFSPGEGAYSRSASSSLRNSGQQFGATIELLRGLLMSAFWPTVLLLLLAQAVPHPNGLTTTRRRALGLSALLTSGALLGLIGQLALLEVGAGFYLRNGGRVYLLPAHALLVMTIAIAAVAPTRRLGSLLSAVRPVGSGA